MVAGFCARMNKLLARALAFHATLKEWLGDGAKPVEPAKAQARADICLKCSFNTAKPLYEALATGAAKIAARQLEVKNAMNLRVRGEKSLHVCEACGCVLRLKVHAPMNVIVAGAEPGSFEKLPEHCWQVKELR